MADRVPLPYPLYGATFGEAVGRFWRKWNVYSGRASRSEFWWAYLFVLLVSMGIGLILGVVLVVAAIALLAPVLASDGDASPAIIASTTGVTFAFSAAVAVVQLPLLVPHIALIVRRLHDAGYSGTLALLLLVPGASIAVLVLCILESKPEGMRFDLPPAIPLQPWNGADPDPSSTIRS